MTGTTPENPVKINYQGNSKLDKAITEEGSATRDEPNKIKKLEGLTVVQKKKSVGQRIRENFGGQDLKSVGLGLLSDVVLPNAKALMFDLIKEGAHRSIYGDSASRSSVPSQIVGSIGTRIRQTNYNAASSQSPVVIGRSQYDTALTQQSKNQFDFSQLLIPERHFAEGVIERLGDAISEFGKVSVGDLYDFLEVSGNGFTDQNHGWDAKAFAGAGIKSHRDGWILVLPNPISLG